MTLALFAAGITQARNVALLVGVGQFQDPALQTEQLLGTAADIDAVQKTLTERGGLPPATCMSCAIRRRRGRGSCPKSLR